jgi:alpha-tubulin suppressor-like RCC1 family protein
MVMNNMDIPGDIIPIPTPSGSYLQVSIGYVYSCALKSDNSMTCWRWINENSNPTVVPILVPSGPYTQISNYCALKSDGQIVCWAGATSNVSFLMQATAPSGPYKQVGGSCGLKTDGTMACWKWQAESYALVERSAPTGLYTQLSAANFGSDFNCALISDGAITCWDWGGTDVFGNERLRLRATPFGSYTQVNDSCALKKDGTIICWEWDLDDEGVINPDALTPIDVPPGSYTQVTYVDGHGCAIKTDGSVTCWGKNDLDQASSPSGSFTQVSAAKYYNCGVLSSGTLDHWGARGYLPNNNPTPFGVFTRISSGSPGSSTACAVRSDGSVVCWGFYSVFFPATI